ncbi:MAG: hypothetical protein Q9218_006364 [Villophora microphyllina]
MKSVSVNGSLTGLLLASSAIAAPPPAYSNLDKRAPQNANTDAQRCNNDRLNLVPECWDILEIDQYLTQWRKDTPDCITTGGSGSSCCHYTPTALYGQESWSTCFLRLATGGAGAHCDELTLSSCPSTLLGSQHLAPTLDPKIRNQVLYVKDTIVTINSFFTSYSSALIGASTSTIDQIYNGFKTSPGNRVPPKNVVVQLPIPQLLALSILNATGTTSEGLNEDAAIWTGALQSALHLAQTMFPEGHDNQQQIKLNGETQPQTNIPTLLAAGLNLTLSDVSTFLAVTQNGRFVGSDGLLTVRDDNSLSNLNVGLNTFVTSKLMQEAGIFATPGDVVAPASDAECSSLNGTLCRTTNGRIYFWSPATHRQYELRSTRATPLALPDLMDKIMNLGWADPQLLFDGNYNCTIAGNAGKEIAIVDGGKVDVSCYLDVLGLPFRKSSGDPSGWGLPPWSVDSSRALMASQGVDTTIFSLTAPGCTILKGAASAQLARAVNEYAVSIRESFPDQFGFFAALPTLADNIPAAIEELAYALDTLKADGVTLYTRYGNTNNYLGHPSFAPLWEELDRRGCVVFVHPTHTVDTSLVNPKLPQPIIDYPHETGRTATDLITSGCMRRYSHVRIILSHAGGTLPYLATRAATLLHDYKLSDKTTEEFLEDAQRFYYDTALSTNEHTLRLLLGFAQKDHILFGTDFPYAPTKTIETHTDMLEGYQLDSESRQRIYRDNALKLLPRFALGKIESVGSGNDSMSTNALSQPSDEQRVAVNGFDTMPPSVVVQ